MASTFALPDIRMKPAGLAVIGTVSALLIWQWVCASGVVSGSAIASPVDTLRGLGALSGETDFWNALTTTIAIWWVGLALAAIIAVPLGIAIGSSDFLYRSTRLVIDFFRTVPVVALVPMALLIGGASASTAVALVVLGLSWLLVMQTIDGVHQVTQSAYDVTAVFQLRRVDVFRFVMLPAALPMVVTALRVAATLSLLVVIGSGVIADTPGIGRSVAGAQHRNESAEVFALVVVCGCLGVLANVVMAALDRRVMARRGTGGQARA